MFCIVIEMTKPFGRKLESLGIPFLYSNFQTGGLKKDLLSHGWRIKSGASIAWYHI